MTISTDTREGVFSDARIVVFDDEQSGVAVMEGLLARWDYHNVVGTTEASDVTPLCAELCPDLLLIDMEGSQPDRFELLQELAPLTTRGEACLPLIVLCGELDDETTKRALSLGAKDFITKPIQPIEACLRVRNLLETRRLYREVTAHTRVLEDRIELRTRELESVRFEFVQRLALAAEYRDEDGAEHVQRVGRTAALLARQLHLPEADVQLIRSVAPLHDIGNIGIPDEVLRRPGKLTNDEFGLVKAHTVIGGKILSGGRSRDVRTAEQIAYSHHERWDGAGYPDGLAGDAIPIAARLTAVADVFDALTHRRPHREPWPLQEALAEIERLGGSHLDPRLVRAFASLDHNALLAPM